MFQCAYIYIYIYASLPRYLENRENKEKSGKLKIDQKNQGKVKEFYKIDLLAIANRANFTSMLKTECA